MSIKKMLISAIPVALVACGFAYGNDVIQTISAVVIAVAGACSLITSVALLWATNKIKDCEKTRNSIAKGVGTTTSKGQVIRICLIRTVIIALVGALAYKAGFENIAYFYMASLYIMNMFMTTMLFGILKYDRG